MEERLDFVEMSSIFSCLEALRRKLSNTYYQWMLCNKRIDIQFAKYCIMARRKFNIIFTKYFFMIIVIFTLALTSFILIKGIDVTNYI